MEKHVKLLGALHIVYGAILLFVGVIVFVAVAGGGQLAESVEVEQLTTGIGALVGGLIVVAAIPSLAGGIGLLNQKSWAWVLVLIGGCLSLLSFPVGTALGVYTIWALLKPETKSLLTH